MAQSVIKQYIARQWRFVSLNQAEKALVYALVIWAAASGTITHLNQTVGLVYLVACLFLLAFCGADFLIGQPIIPFFTSYLGRFSLTINGFLLAILFWIASPSATADITRNIVFSFILWSEIFIVTGRYKWTFEVWGLIVASFIHLLLNLSLMNRTTTLTVVPVYLLILVLTLFWSPAGNRHTFLPPFFLNLKRLARFHVMTISAIVLLSGLLVLITPVSTLYHFLFTPSHSGKNTPDGNQNRRNWVNDTAALDVTPGTLSLGDIASLKSQDVIVMLVRLRDENGELYHPPEPLYLRGKVFEQYENGKWVSLENESRKLLRGDANGVVTCLKTLPKFPYAWLRQEIRLGPRSDGTLYAIPEPYRMAQFGSLICPKKDVFERPEFRHPIDYIVQSVLPDYPTATLKNITSVNSQDIYLQIPGRLDRLAALSRQITQNTSGVWNKTQTLANYLSQNYQYDLSAADEGSDDSLEEFLFRRKTGYCVHFASALATMLRAVRIPARLSTGFLMREYHADTKQYTVRGRDAHAWTEVYFGPDYGWVTFDATPASFRENPALDVASNMTHPTQPVSPTGSLRLNLNFGSFFWVIIFIALFLVVSLILFILKSKKGAGNNWLRIFSLKKRLTSVGFYDDFLRLMKRQGFPKPAALTGREYVQTLALPDFLGEISLITNAFYEVKYGQQTLPAPVIKSLKQALQRLQSNLKRPAPTTN